jgi:hypothetical protein
MEKNISLIYVKNYRILEVVIDVYKVVTEQWVDEKN